MSGKVFFLHLAIWTLGLAPMWTWPLIEPSGRWWGVAAWLAALGVSTAAWASGRLQNRFGGEPPYRERVAKIASICYRDCEHPNQQTIREILRVAKP